MQMTTLQYLSILSNRTGSAGVMTQHSLTASMGPSGADCQAATLLIRLLQAMHLHASCHMDSLQQASKDQMAFLSEAPCGRGSCQQSFWLLQNPAWQACLLAMRNALTILSAEHARQEARKQQQTQSGDP